MSFRFSLPQVVSFGRPQLVRAVRMLCTGVVLLGSLGTASAANFIDINCNGMATRSGMSATTA